MSSLETLQSISWLLALFAILQSLEFLNLRKIVSDTGIWRWPDLEPELGVLFRPWMNARSFFVLNILRLLLAFTLFFALHPGLLLGLLIIHVLTLLRFRGSFNGGSDAMNLVALWTTTLGLFLGGQWAMICIWFLALQLCLSYFKAGWYKLRSSAWRRGIALDEFLHACTYQKLKLRSVPKAVHWAIFIFELSFPLALFHPTLALAYMTLGILFHLANSYFFGLNRFLYAWCTAYPALYYCAMT